MGNFEDRNCLQTKRARVQCAKYVPQVGDSKCVSYISGGMCRLNSELMCTEWLRANAQGAEPAPEGPPMAQPSPPPSPIPAQPSEGPPGPPESLSGSGPGLQGEPEAPGALRGVQGPRTPTCAVDGCGAPVFRSRGGLVCQQGHGGAPFVGDEALAPVHPDDPPESGQAGERPIPLDLLAAAQPRTVGTLDEADVKQLEADCVEVLLEIPKVGKVWLVPEPTSANRRELRFRDLLLILRAREVFPESTLVEINAPKVK